MKYREICVACGGLVAYWYGVFCRGHISLYKSSDCQVKGKVYLHSVSVNLSTETTGVSLPPARFSTLIKGK